MMVWELKMRSLLLYVYGNTIGRVFARNREMSCFSKLYLTLLNKLNKTVFLIRLSDILIPYCACPSFFEQVPFTSF